MSEQRNISTLPLRYTISVCPKCNDHPLVFDPHGLDAYEGLTLRAVCRNGHLVLAGETKQITVQEIAA